MSESRGSKEIAGSPSTEASARCFFYWLRIREALNVSKPNSYPVVRDSIGSDTVTVPMKLHLKHSKRRFSL
jgi:hypothetical protein